MTSQERSSCRGVEVGVLAEAFSSTTSISASVLEDKRFRKQHPIAIGILFCALNQATKLYTKVTTTIADFSKHDIHFVHHISTAARRRTK